MVALDCDYIQPFRAWRHVDLRCVTLARFGLSSDVGRGQEGIAMADRPASDFDMCVRVATANAM